MNVKEGDLAIVIDSIFPQNIGVIVNVMEFVGDIGERKNLWLVESARPMMCRNTATGHTGAVTRGVMSDRLLRPVSGLPDDDSVSNESKLHA